MKHKFGKNFEQSKLDYYSFTPDKMIEKLGISYLDCGAVYFLLDRRSHRLYISSFYFDDVTFRVDEKATLSKLAKMSLADFEKFAVKNLVSNSGCNVKYVFSTKSIKRQVITWLSKNGINPNNFKKYKSGYLIEFWHDFDEMVNGVLNHFSYYNGFDLDFKHLSADEHKFDFVMRGINTNYVAEFADFKNDINPHFEYFYELLKLGLRQAKKQGKQILALDEYKAANYVADIVTADNFPVNAPAIITNRMMSNDQ